ncbi:hypothetical protein ACXIUS_21655 [Bosea thiooxidans]
MPHISVEYSRHVPDVANVSILVEALHRAAVELGVFSVGAIRIFAHQADAEIVGGCPSSDDLRLFRCLRSGGSGSSGFEAMRPAGDAASVFAGWSGA